MRRPSPTDVELEALAARLVPLVLARLASALGSAVESPYTTRKGGPVPPEYEGRAKRWRTDAAMIPGAVRVGRWWSIPRAAYSAWLTAQSSTPVPASPANDAPEPWSPATALAAAGLRRTR